MPTPSPLAIEVTGLVKSFGDTKAVDGVDLAVRSGSVYGVLGPNGAGKTTTIRMLATLLRPDAGEAKVLGHDVVTESDAVRSAVSLTGQLASVDEDLTGRENLILLARLLGLSRNAAKERATELLDAFGLAEAANKLVKNYSGGMRRRLDLSASIVVTPQVMFLDEPTTGLDPKARNQVWDIIRALASEGTTILLCTQYLEEADRLCEGIAVIDHGKVIAEGTPAQLKASVGVGTLNLRLLDPEQRPEAERILDAELGEVHLEGDPAALSASCADGDRAAEAVGQLSRNGMQGGRVLARPAQPGRGVPRAHRQAGRAGGRRRRRTRDAGGGAGGMSTTSQQAPEQAAVRTALATSPRPPQPGPLTTAMTFGWRGMLKIKHVPEQLLDVLITPVLFTVMFTYIYGGAISGSTGEYLQFILPGSLVMSVLFTTVYSGVALNTDLTKGVVDRFRSLPIWRAAPLVGASVGDLVRYTIAGTVVILVGFVLGYSAEGGLLGVVAALALVVRVLDRAGLGLHHPRPDHARAQRGAQRRLHGAVPAAVPEQRVRAAGDAPERAEAVRGREPGLAAGDRRARADERHGVGGRGGDPAGDRRGDHGRVPAAHRAAVPHARLNRTASAARCGRSAATVDPHLHKVEKSDPREQGGQPESATNARIGSRAVRTRRLLAVVPAVLLIALVAAPRGATGCDDWERPEHTRLLPVLRVRRVHNRAERPARPSGDLAD